jgi:hypothetical protein
MFRFSGDYSPLFYDIDLFRCNNINEYYEVQMATASFGATFSYGTYSYSNFTDLINNVTSSISNDITFSYLSSDNKYRFYEFLSNDFKDKTVLSIKFKSYDTNSENWLKIQSISEGDVQKSKVVKRLINNTPISNYETLNGNYKFDTELTYFGIEKEKVFRKVNRKEILLKLKDTVGAKPIYPMLDEFGYHFTDFFIFKSSWDLEYHIETGLFKPILKTTTEKTVVDKIYDKNQEDIENLVFDFNSFGKVDDFLLNSYGKIYDTNEIERKTAGPFPIKIESDSAESNPFRPKITEDSYDLQSDTIVKPPRPDILPNPDPDWNPNPDPDWNPNPDPDWNPDIPDPVTPDPVIPDPVIPDPIIPDWEDPDDSPDWNPDDNPDWNPDIPDPVTPDPVTPDPVTPDPVIPDWEDPNNNPDWNPDDNNTGWG